MIIITIAASLVTLTIGVLLEMFILDMKRYLNLTMKWLNSKDPSAFGYLKLFELFFVGVLEIFEIWNRMIVDVQGIWSKIVATSSLLKRRMVVNK